MWQELYVCMYIHPLIFFCLFVWIFIFIVLYFVCVLTFQLVAFAFIFVLLLSSGIAALSIVRGCAATCPKQHATRLRKEYKFVCLYVHMCECVIYASVRAYGICAVNVRPSTSSMHLNTCRSGLPSQAHGQCSAFVYNKTTATTSATPSLTHWVCCIMLHVAVHSRSVRCGASAVTACWRFYPPRCYCYCYCFYFPPHFVFLLLLLSLLLIGSLYLSSLFSLFSCLRFPFNFFHYYYYVLLLFWICFCMRSEAEKNK